MIKFLFAFIFCVLGSSSALAAGLAVTLYPDSADVREELILSSENNTVSVLLPRGVLPGSVRLSVEGAAVRSVVFVDVPRVDAPRTQAVRDALTAAQAVLTTLDAQLAVVAARINLWQNPPVRLSDEAALTSADTAVAAHLPPLLAERVRLEALRAAAVQDVQRSKNALRRVFGQTEHTGQNSMSGENGVQALTTQQLTATLVPLSAETPLGATLSGVLEYSLGQCGWTPEYRLEALTDVGQVRVSRMALLHQSSGRDWATAALRLSTARPAAHVNPMPVRDWLIVPSGPEPRNADSAPMRAMGMAPTALKSARMSAAPMYEEGASAMTWDLGTQAVNSGDEMLLTLDTQNWKADFLRLLRPSQQSASWLVASVTPPTPQLLPEARARLVVDGVSMGETSFAFSGDKGDVVLGIDPAVTADMVLDSNQSGDRGIIAKSQTRVWSWHITVRNAHSQPVAVRVEDAAPQSGHERIVARVESTPAATRENNVLRWAFTLPANGTSDIAHSVSLSAPADMRVRAGR